MYFGPSSTSGSWVFKAGMIWNVRMRNGTGLIRCRHFSRFSYHELAQHQARRSIKILWIAQAYATMQDFRSTKIS